MKIYKIHTLWPERGNFELERKSVGDQYIFLHVVTNLYTKINGELVLMPAGSCICYPPGSYQFLKTSGSDLLHDWAHFSSDFGKIAEKYGFLPLKVYTMQDSGFVTDIMRTAELEFLNDDEFSESLYNLEIEKLIAKIVRDSGKTGRESISQKLHTSLVEARNTIHMQYHKAWTIDEMASLVHLSSSRFFALYKSFFGVSPKSDLSYVRMEHAKHILRFRNLPIAEVAEMTGYTNVYHFIRAFKAYTGMTPGKYKSCQNVNT